MSAPVATPTLNDLGRELSRLEITRNLPAIRNRVLNANGATIVLASHAELRMWQLSLDATDIEPQATHCSDLVRFACLAEWGGWTIKAFCLSSLVEGV